MVPAYPATSLSKPVFNVYCDESCHLEGDGIGVMVLGAVICPAGERARLADAIRALKERHGLRRDFEVKWTKVSPAKLDFYLELVDLFLLEECLTSRSLVVPDKDVLDHSRFSQSHDDWYYKMYYTLLNPVFRRDSRYRVYIDIKDTRGAPKDRKLHEVLCNSRWDFDRECVERVQQVRSHESELLQLADLLIGAIGYTNRGLLGSAAKSAIVQHLTSRLGEKALVQTSYLSTRKLNLLVWQPRGTLV